MIVDGITSRSKYPSGENMHEHEVATLQLVPKPKRQRAKWSRSEATQAQGNLFEKMLVHHQQVRDLREGKPHKLIMIANSLVLCGLPYRPTDALKIVRTAKTGSGRTRVTFHALASDESGQPIPMARGTDRTYLHWAIDRAIKLKNLFVPFECAREFFDDMEMCTSGENYRALRDTQRRLSGLNIFVERFGSYEDRLPMNVFGLSRLPKSVAPNCSSIDGPSGLRFGEEFFKEISKNPIPFLLPMLRTLSKKPQMQDYALFLHHRSYSSESTSRIPWAMLREQLWQDDKTSQRIRVRMDEAIVLLRTAWPELNAATTREGLIIGPPTDRSHLIPEFVVKRSRLG
jgi:hypothetical protein